MRRSEPKDVCVIGTGAAGGVWIDACTRAGLEVVALERGPELGPADFVEHDELSNIHRSVGFAPKWQDTLREHDGEPARLGRSVLLAQCVGGGTVHWGSWSWRFRENDFRARSVEGSVEGANLADWPIGYQELAPFYDRAEARLGIAGRAGSNPLEAPRGVAVQAERHVPGRAEAAVHQRGRANRQAGRYY